MKILSLAFSTAAAALLTAVAGGAFADVAPPDACTGVGTACSNAGPNNTEAGVCRNGMCPHATFGGAGGMGTVEEPCTICVQTGASSSSSSSGAGGGGGGGASSSSGGSSSSCSISSRTSDGMIAGSMLMVGLSVLLAERSRARRRRG
jgi:hypothetical protein